MTFGAIIVISNLLLQEPSRNSNSKDQLETLKRRLDLCKEGELTEFLIDVETTQKSLSDSKSIKGIAELCKKFKKYVEKHNVNAVLKLLTNSMKDGILLLNNETLNSLKKNKIKSPIKKFQQQRFTESFASIIEEIIRKAVIKTKGVSGLSVIDTCGWSRILCSSNFGNTNVDIRKAIANFVKEICSDKSANRFH